MMFSFIILIIYGISLFLHDLWKQPSQEELAPAYVHVDEKS